MVLSVHTWDEPWHPLSYQTLLFGCFTHGPMTTPEGSAVTSVQSSPRDALNSLDSQGGVFFFHLPQHWVRFYDLRSWDCRPYCVCCHCLPWGVCSPLFFPFLLFCLLYPIVMNKNFCLTAALFTFVMIPFMLCFGILLRRDRAEVLASGPSLALPTFWWGFLGGFWSSASPFSFVVAHQQQPPCP